MKKLSLYLFFLCSITFGQNLKLGKVSEEEILQKAHPKDSSANAAYLFKTAKTTMIYDNGWQYVHDVEVRLKIYKQDGFNFANVQIPIYRNSGSKEKITNLNAFTYALEDGKITKEKLKNDGIFEEEVTENWTVLKFTLPKIKEGSVVEYSYKITSPFISTLPEFVFQETIPVETATYTVSTPEYLSYNPYHKGVYYVKQTKNTKRDKLTIRYEPNAEDVHRGIRGSTSSYKSQILDLDYLLETVVYEVEDVPKIRDEAFVSNIKNYFTAVKHELAWIKMPGSTMNYYAQTWEDVAKSIYQNNSFGSEIESRKYFEDDLDNILQTTKSQEEKVHAIYNFVKQKVKWNNNYGIFTKQGVVKAYSEGVGNVAEINLMLTAMLQHAGINAHPVLLSTKSNGIPYFPTRDGFNYVISCAEIDNSFMLLDATNIFGTPNVLPDRALNWIGRLVRNDFKSAAINLMPNTPSRRVINLDFNMNQNNTIDGLCRNTLTEQLAYNQRNKLGSFAESSYQDYLESVYKNTEIFNIDIVNRTDVYKPYIENFQFSKPNSFDVIGDKLYFNPLFFMTTTENSFKAETREFPIDFNYPTSKTILAQIKIPEGYEIESIPENAAYKMPDDLGEFSYAISTTGNRIQLRVFSEIKSPIISTEYYESLKAFYKLLVEKETEKVVLTKI